MLKIIKEFKPFTLLIALIVGLLFAQAMTDLALPDYMSKIVNVGIQQNGIDEKLPRVLQKKELDKLKLFLTEDEAQAVEKVYQLKGQADFSEAEYKKIARKYPVIEKEPLYFLQEGAENSDAIANVQNFLGKTMLIVLAIEKDGEGGFQILGADTSRFSNLPEGADPFDSLKNLPKEQLMGIRASLDEKLSVLPESMVEQASTAYIRNQYEAMGMDIEKNQSNYILSLGGLMLLIAFGGMVASIAVGFLASRIGAGVGKNLRDKVFSKVISFSNGEFNEFSTASLITRSTNDIQQIQQFTVMMLRMVFYAPILGIGGVIRAVNTNTSMAWIVAIGVAGISLLVLSMFAFAMPKFKKVQKLVDKINLVTRESLTGMLVIRAFNTEKYEEDKFEKANQDLTRTNLFVSRVMSMMMPIMNVIMNGVILLIVWVGAHEIEKANIQVGDMMAFVQYAMQIIMSFLMLSMVSIILPRASVSAQRIAEVLEKEVAIQDPQTPARLQEQVQGKIEFKNVSFKYPDAENEVLKNVSFVANPGETTAFIGSTGSGKSTVVNLIPRFYDATSGEILIDNVNVKDLTLHSLRENIGYVPQKGTLFSGTIKSNLLFGKNKDASNSDIEEAIETSQSKEFIETKKEGIETEVAQGGSNVSGGQKQRLSIARALVKKPKMLIFDDSFSALDFKTDANLRKAIHEGIQDSTLLIVAQRINTIMNAQKIIVLHDGEIVGTGKHKDLLQNCEVYRQIALSQLSEEELAI